MIYKKLKKIFSIFYILVYSKIFIKKEYFLCNRGIGDTIIFLAKLQYYKQKYPDKEVNLIIQENQRMLIEPYQKYIADIIVFSKWKMEAMMQTAYTSMLPSRIQFILPKGTLGFLGYNDLSIHDAINITLGFQYADFRLDVPKFQWKEGRKKEIIEQYQLEPGKTVILAVDAVSVPLISNEIWDSIVAFYQQAGYKVITNLGKSTAPALSGTIGLYLPLNEIFLLAEYSGFFIGLRSGICDLLALSSCKMLVIYPSEKDEVYRKKYSLKNMKYNKDIEEIMDYEVNTWLKESCWH